MGEPWAGAQDDHLRRLEQAVNLLWGWMPAPQVKEIASDAPELAELCRVIHQKVDHGEYEGEHGTITPDEVAALWPAQNDGSGDGTDA